MTNGRYAGQVEERIPGALIGYVFEVYCGIAEVYPEDGDDKGA